MRVASLVSCLCVLLLTGCASMGPPSIARDRFDYVTSVSESWKRQMLLNLLKVRYTDAPVFMDVSSVINSYSLEGEITLSGQNANIGRGDTFAAIAGTGRYADRPTISYQPLSGDKFAKNLLAPLPVTGILYLIQAGYPADIVLRLCVSTINGLENAYGAMGNPRAGDPKFRELLTAFRESQQAGGTGMRVVPGKDQSAVLIYFRPLTDEAIAAPNRRIRELLELDPTAREISVVYGSHPANDREIAMLTRSVLQVLTDFASYIDVPDAELTEGRVYRPQRSAEQLALFPPLFRVRNGRAAPQDAYVAVQYRDTWFWIDDRDQHSKALFNSVLLLFSLTETAQTQPAPLVTIPAR
ncbi:MAG TPA: hypothetical protein VFP70_11820 [Burkholderiales bacterium]|nr:hypothetical protein [Burkholderiales bacterium]